MTSKVSIVLLLSLSLLSLLYKVEGIEVYIDEYGEVVTERPLYTKVLLWPAPASMQDPNIECEETLDVQILSHNKIYTKQGWFHWEQKMSKGSVAEVVSLYNVQEFVTYCYYNTDMWSLNTCDSTREVFSGIIKVLLENAGKVDFSNYSDSIVYNTKFHGAEVTLMCKPSYATDYVPCTVSNIKDVHDIIQG